MKWSRFLVPRIPRGEIGKMAAITAVGALLGGVYGVVHDQVTYRISEEYFTRYKFDQFAFAAPSSDAPLVFASRIGFLATWWIGALVAWSLARGTLMHSGVIAPISRLRNAFGIVFLACAFAAVAGWCWGRWRVRTGYAEGWIDWMNDLGVEDQEAFMSVGYIHNASYLGGVIGAGLAILYLVRGRSRG